MQLRQISTVAGANYGFVLTLLLRRSLFASEKVPPWEVFMPFTVRPYHRFPVSCPETYQTGLFWGQGTVWNFSLTGWRFSGNLPLRIREVCSRTVNLSIDQTIYVGAGIVRWVRGGQCGVETLVIDDESREDLEESLCQRLAESAENIE